MPSRAALKMMPTPAPWQSEAQALAVEAQTDEEPSAEQPSSEAAAPWHPEVETAAVEAETDETAMAEAVAPEVATAEAQGTMVRARGGSWRGDLGALPRGLNVFDRRICRAARRDERCVRLREVPGVGPLTATALVATVGNAREFKSGRELSAYLGLTPRQHSSGGKTVLLGISKHGNRYLRTLLIHGARSLMRRKNPIPHPRAQWAARLAAARGTNLATVALANHNARVLWALLSRGEAYRGGTPKGSFPPRPSNRVVERVRGGKLLVVNRT